MPVFFAGSHPLTLPLSWYVRLRRHARIKIFVQGSQAVKRCQFAEAMAAWMLLRGVCTVWPLRDFKFQAASKRPAVGSTSRKSPHVCLASCTAIGEPRFVSTMCIKLNKSSRKTNTGNHGFS